VSETNALWQDFERLEQLFSCLIVDLDRVWALGGDADDDPNECGIGVIKACITTCGAWSDDDWDEFRRYCWVVGERRFRAEGER
jgi:hypothetical protein